MKVTIIGGGISGVSLAYLLTKHTQYDIVLIEKENIGGKALTVRKNDYLIETGPNGFLSNKREILKLIEESGFENQVIESSKESNRKFIYSHGKLWEIPKNPMKLIFSNFLSLNGKLIALKEPFVKPFPNDETVENFVNRRLGNEFLNKIIGPMVCGVFAGDPRIMSMKSNFPKIKEIEIKYGSLIKGLINLMKENKATADAVSGGFSSKLLSFKDGILSFINHLSRGLVIIKDRIISIKKSQPGFFLLGEKDTYTSDVVIFATPAYSLSKIISNYDKELATLLKKIPYAPMAVLALGYKNKNLPSVKDSFGYLFNLKDIKDTIGVLFDSSIFDYRASKEKVLIRVMIGGQLAKDSVFKNNLTEMGTKELQRSAQIHSPFEFSYIKKHSMAIPVYTMEHKQILGYIKEFEAKNRGIIITGNAFYGVSLNDCVKSAYNTLDRIKRGL